MSAKIATALLAGSMPLFAFAAEENPFGAVREEPFTDVKASDANYEAIEYLRENSVLRGYPDGTYKADRRINRAEFVYLITNPFILDTSRMNECITQDKFVDKDTVYFPDVMKSVWYAPAVCHASERDLIDGYPDGTYKPGEYINFVEAAKILSNVFVLNTSREPTDRWFDPYVKKLAEVKAIPSSIETFNDQMTRGEMAEMLFRLKAGRTDKSSPALSNIKEY